MEDPELVGHDALIETLNAKVFSEQPDSCGRSG